MSAPATTRTPLPEGTAPVGIALLIGGIATYAFFRIGTWAVGGDEAFKPISSLWFATFALAPGFFLPLEQEIGRALSARRALGQGGRPVLDKIVRLAAVMVTVVLLAILAISPLIAADYFDGDWVMVIALMVAFAAYAPAIIARGHLLGHRAASTTTPSSSAATASCGSCSASPSPLVGIEAAGAYGFAVALAPLVGLALRRLPRRAAHRRRPGGDVEGGRPEPRLAAPRLGVRGRPPQRRPDRHHAARRPGPGRAGHAVRLRRAARPHPAVHVPGRAGRPAPPAQPAGGPRRARRVPRRAEAPAGRRARRRLRRHGRRPRARPVRHRHRLRRRPQRPHARHAGARQRLLHGRPVAGPGRHRPAAATRTSPSAG